MHVNVAGKRYKIRYLRSLNQTWIFLSSLFFGTWSPMYFFFNFLLSGRPLDIIEYNSRLLYL